MFSSELISAGAFILVLLLSGNAYFIKRLVSQIDKVSGLSEAINLLSPQLAEIKQDIKDLRRIEIEVAVLRSQMSQTHSPELG